ncbi:hypothetical protein [Saccharothrix variisporea]|uniref:Secreted protein n=1 Tax=Saccharothrix variisporea TaxID=543527 RepID=A0A495X1E1_9PSEU|nr:hypothetical protein [Saccharothrix variisporea]RKT67024.1 hypothetical protein DFJ66_0192 [Saccharothrix variisporea]
MRRFTDWAFLAAVLAVATAAAITLSRPTPAPAHSTHQPDLVPAAHSDGLSEAEGGYRFERVTTPDSRGPAVPVAFRILGPDGTPQTRFLDNQTKQLHFFAIRDDMHVFQHVHPTLVGDTWHTTLSLPDGGAYRMFAEFVPTDTKDPRHPVVLGVPFSVPGDTTLVPVPEPSTKTVTPDGFAVERIDTPEHPAVMKPHSLRFAIKSPDGTPVRALEPHLGANGHMTGFHTMLLSATHLHPVEPAGAPLVNGELTFQAVFADRGEYRLFLEFSHGGTLHTAAFTVSVI